MTMIDYSKFASNIATYFHFSEKCDKLHPFVESSLNKIQTNSIMLHDANLLLHLLSIPPNGHGLLHCFKLGLLTMDLFYRHLMESNDNNNRKQLDDDYNRIKNNLIIYYGYIRDNGSKETRVESSIGYRDANPIFGFVMESARYMDDVRIKYKIKVFFPYILELLYHRLYIAQDTTSSTFAHIGLAARKLLLAPPIDNSVYRSFKPMKPLLSQRKQLYNDVAEFLNKQSMAPVTKESDNAAIRRLIDKTDRIHHEKRRKLRSRFHGRKLRMIGALGSLDAVYHDVLSSNLIIDDNSTISASIKTSGDFSYKIAKYYPSVTELQEPLDEGESIEELNVGPDIIVFPVRAFRSNKWPGMAKTRTINEAISFSKNLHAYDKCCCPPCMMHLIASKSYENESFTNDSRVNSNIALIIQLTVFLGLSIKQLLKIRLLDFDRYQNVSDLALYYDSVEKPIMIDISTGMLYHHNHLSCWKEVENSNNQYIETENPYSVALPCFIKKLLPTEEEYKDNSYLFSSDDVRNTIKKIRLISGGEVKLNNLRNLFLAYYVFGAGMSELSACFIRGDVPWYLGSQLHYTTLNWSHLHEEWVRMTIGFRDCIKNGYGIEETLNAMAFMRGKGANVTCTSVPSDVLFVGARKTPSDIAMKNHLSYLYSMFPHSFFDFATSASPAQWNAYTAYLFSVYALCTGKRPVSDSPFDIRSLATIGLCHFCDEKHGSRSKMSRTMMFCPTLHQMLVDYRDILGCWIRHAIDSGYRYNGDNSALILANETTMSLEPFKQSELDQALGFPPPPYILGLGNSYRHYLLSRLAELGVDQSMIDFISGHRCGGSEPEFYSSLLRWDHTAKELSLIIEKEIIKFLDIKQPVHHHGF